MLSRWPTNPSGIVPRAARRNSCFDLPQFSQFFCQVLIFINLLCLLQFHPSIPWYSYINNLANWLSCLLQLGQSYCVEPFYIIIIIIIIVIIIIIIIDAQLFLWDRLSSKPYIRCTSSWLGYHYQVCPTSSLVTPWVAILGTSVN